MRKTLVFYFSPYSNIQYVVNFQSANNKIKYYFSIKKLEILTDSIEKSNLESFGLFARKLLVLRVW